MSKITNFTQWFYFHPVFSESSVEASGHVGLVKSGVNLAVWSVGVGLIAHVAGSKNACWWGVGFFAAAVAGEVVFGLSGPSNNRSHIQMFPSQAAPGTSTSLGPWNGSALSSAPGYAESGNASYGEGHEGYN